MDNNLNITPINEDLNVARYEENSIKNLIYYIRGKQVILDSDIAKLYQVETKKLNQAVKRNIERFPENFCFQLTEDEYNSLRSQFVTLKNYGRGQHRKYLPYVFTEQGISMLSTVLHSNIAIQVSIKIMNAFIDMREFLYNNRHMLERLSNVEYKLLEYDNKFNQIFDFLQNNKSKEVKQKLFFKGQIWDSYELIIDIIKKAKISIVIIDNYIDDSILKMLCKKNKNVKALILTSPTCNITKLDIAKFNHQYPTLKVAKTNKFHDRFIFIDSRELYHLRCFFKRFRYKMFWN